MMTQTEAARFAREWIDAWNSHDLERVLSHYTDDFEMSSPFIVSIGSESSGTLRGKDSVRAYWQTALQRHPDLHFDLLEGFVGASSLVIFYNAVQGKRATEVLWLDESGRIYKAMAHYNTP